MKKYYVVVRLRGDEAVTLFEEERYADALAKVTNIVINIRDVEFVPLSRDNSARHISKREIVEIRVEDFYGNVAYKEQD